MGDEAKKKPKLRLSREPEDGGQSDDPQKPEKEAANPDAETPGAGKKAEPTASAETPVDNGPAKTPDYDPDDPFGDILGQKQPGKQKKPRKRSPEDEAEQAARSSLGAEPSAKPPPERPSKPAPKVDDGSGQQLEKSIETLAAETRPRRNHAGLWALLVLFLIFGGAGYGIFLVLRDDGGAAAPSKSAETSGNPGTTKPAADDTTGTASGGGPITRAKETIATVDREAVNAVTDAESAPTAPSVPSAGAGASTGATPDESTDTPEPSTTRAAPAEKTRTEANADAPDGPSLELRDAVADFLKEARIGAVRSGEDARVMLNGQNYSVGDTVQPATGLVFGGTKNGRLVFRDRNGVFYVKRF